MLVLKPSDGEWAGHQPLPRNASFQCWKAWKHLGVNHRISSCGVCFLGFSMWFAPENSRRNSRGHLTQAPDFWSIPRYRGPPPGPNPQRGTAQDVSGRFPPGGSSLAAPGGSSLSRHCQQLWFWWFLWWMISSVEDEEWSEWSVEEVLFACLVTLRLSCDYFIMDIYWKSMINNPGFIADRFMINNWLLIDDQYEPISTNTWSTTNDKHLFNQ